MVDSTRTTTRTRTRSLLQLLDIQHNNPTPSSTEEAWIHPSSRYASLILVDYFSHVFPQSGGYSQQQYGQADTYSQNYQPQQQYSSNPGYDAPQQQTYQQGQVGNTHPDYQNQQQGGAGYPPGSNPPPGQEGERGLGATLLGGASGAFVGHEMGGGFLGVMGGVIAGAVGANWLENKHEK